jgi:RimJ/RimL family protein N-acetyltransferase
VADIAAHVCAFQTKRLSVAGWHLPASTLDGSTIADAMVEMLTRPVTQSLPPDWAAPASTERAEAWIAARDAEGDVSLVIERSSRSAIGLVVLHWESAGSGRVDVRLGYLLAETAWGRGLGGELVVGVARWSRGQRGIGSVIAGVAPDNVASIKVLERSGFERSSSTPGDADELEYRLEAHSWPAETDR